MNWRIESMDKNEQRMYTVDEVKNIINSIDYSDLLDDDDHYDLVELSMRLYQKGRKGNSPDCLLRSALHHAVEEGIKYYYIFEGEQR